ncbi:hypothetical protein BD779DRAFT_302363 [Infundibulicybe gibba]|nr:hypothetical protein BD779DRAFT_302363 [Infundibulicybe gibba]
MADTALLAQITPHHLAAIPAHPLARVILNPRPITPTHHPHRQITSTPSLHPTLALLSSKMASSAVIVMLVDRVLRRSLLHLPGSGARTIIINNTNVRFPTCPIRCKYSFSQRPSSPHLLLSPTLSYLIPAALGDLRNHLYPARRILVSKLAGFTQNMTRIKT